MERSTLVSTAAGPRFSWLRRAWWQVTAGRRFRAAYYERLSTLVSDQAPSTVPVQVIGTEPSPFAR